MHPEDKNIKSNIKLHDINFILQDKSPAQNTWYEQRKKFPTTKQHHGILVLST